MPYTDQYVTVASTAVYFTGLACFKTAAGQMPELRGVRPVQLSLALATHGLWAAGALILVSGALLQVSVLGELTLLQAQPLLMAGLATLLVLALLGRGERLSPREWGSVALLAAATALITLSRASAEARESAPTAQEVVAVAVPSLLLPTLAFLLGDLARKGSHRRPTNGVALAVSVGLLTGTAELMLKGMAERWTDPAGLLASPQPYLFLLATPLALGQLQIALQRCRLVIVGLVATATAKTYLLVAALTVYAEPWPDRWDLVLLGLFLSVLAIAAIPRHAVGLARPAASAPRGHRL
ncbi:hypothetical protein [Actinocorallia aurantiaca]|uniref:Uncharacterized protein n=1 Tax=Actinocorallia aurantiaca TaxID=46204 RepID=A0ABP6GNZ0_9ACTN